MAHDIFLPDTSNGRPRVMSQRAKCLQTKLWILLRYSRRELGSWHRAADWTQSCEFPTCVTPDFLLPFMSFWAFFHFVMKCHQPSFAGLHHWRRSQWSHQLQHEGATRMQRILKLPGIALNRPRSTWWTKEWMKWWTNKSAKWYRWFTVITNFMQLLALCYGLHIPSWSVLDGVGKGTLDMEDHTLQRTWNNEVVTLRQPSTSIGFSRQGQRVAAVDW